MANLTIRQGSTWRPTLRVRTVPDGEPYDLTGWGLRMQIRADIADRAPVVLADLSIGSGITVTDAPGGVVELLLTATQTRMLPATPPPLAYDIEAITPDGDTLRWASGRVTVEGEVTR